MTPVRNEGRRVRRCAAALASASLGASLLITTLVTSGAGGARSASRPLAPTTSTSLPRSDGDAALTALQRRAAATPNDSGVWKDLASAALRRAYETADPSYYALASTAIERAGRLVHDTAAVRVLRSQLRLGLHDFAGARREAMAVLAAEPANFDAKLVLTDSSIELGAYEQAAKLVADLVDQRPGVASLSRLYYLRQLNGDLLGAESAMRAAVSSAPEGSLDQAVALAYLGDVLSERGRNAAAERSFREALARHPGSSVAAIGLARVLAGRGDLRAADATLRALVERVPVPAALGLRAEIARVRGDRAAAQAADQLVDASIALLRANGVAVDAELALLLADRDDADHAAAIAAADRAYATRRTIFTADAQAWSRFRAGRASEAVGYIRIAIASAPGVASVHWHAAAIFEAVGADAQARRELELANRNPSFSPSQRPLLTALARRLGVTL